MNLAGWVELLFIALLAFMIIGPKDLPKVLFFLGRLLKTLRNLSDEFLSEFEALQHFNEESVQQKKLPEKGKNDTD